MTADISEGQAHQSALWVIRVAAHLFVAVAIVTLAGLAGLWLNGWFS